MAEAQCGLPYKTIDNPNRENIVEWLKHNVARSSRVNSFMEKTAVKRAERIGKNPGQSFYNILKEYPRLFDTAW